MRSRLGSRRFQDHLIGLSLAALLLAVLLANARNIGFARDEGFYFDAARSYQHWFDLLVDRPSMAFTQEAIDRYYKVNHEHPALMKTLFGFSNRFFNQKLGILAPSTSFRLPGMITAALTVYLLFLFGSEVFDRRVGIAAAAFFALMPRVFYHSHLACFDMPITLMWLVVTYLYWRSLSSTRFGIAAGAMFGVALATKLNAFFLPFVLGLHYLALLVERRRRGESLPKPWAFVAGIVLAPPIFLGHWPWLWHDTFHRLGGYMGFHSAHPHYNTAWFGENIVQAPTPIALPTVMTLFTVPSVIILLFVFGVCLRMRHHVPSGLAERFKRLPSPAGPPSSNGFDLLWLLAAGFPIALISLPSVPVFGGAKHWMPAYPFLALIAAAAAVRLADHLIALKPAWPRQWISAATLAALILPPLQQTATSTPFGLASYVPLIGGARGAATLGMTRQFWGYTTRGVIPFLNETYPNGARVELHDTTVSAWRMYQEDGILNENLKPSHLGNSDVALMHHELHMVRNEAWIWNRYRTVSPVHVLTYQGVPMVSVYQKKRLQE